MKKFIFFLLLISVFSGLSFGSFAQGKVLENSFNEQYITIPGTSFALIPPDTGFVFSSQYQGLDFPSWKAGINIMVLPQGLENLLGTFRKTVLAEKGEISKETEVQLNGSKGHLFKIKVLAPATSSALKDEQGKGIRLTSWLLLLDKDKKSFFIGGRYPQDLDESLSDKFEQSLLSFINLQEHPHTPFDALSFTLDIQASPLKFAKTLSQLEGALFTRDGKAPTEKEASPILKVQVFPLSIPKKNQKNQSIQNIKAFGESAKVEEINKVEVDGLTGYEVIAYESMASGQKILHYGFNLYDSDRFFQMNGMAFSNFDQALEMFRKLSNSFKRK